MFCCKALRCEQGSKYKHETLNIRRSRPFCSFVQRIFHSVEKIVTRLKYKESTPHHVSSARVRTAAGCKLTLCDPWSVHQAKLDSTSSCKHLHCVIDNHFLATVLFRTMLNLKVRMIYNVRTRISIVRIPTYTPLGESTV